MSLTAAAMMSCSVALGSGGWSLEGAAASVAVGDYSNDERVPVIVKVSGDAVLATAEGMANGDAFLDSAEAERMEQNLESVQARVERNIRSFYPELTIKYNYSVLYNGFYCDMPESLIPYVEELDYVESVTIVRPTAVPMMANAPGLSGYPAYYNETGCTGEGQVIAVIDTELDVTHPMFAPLAEDKETSLTKTDVAELAASGKLNMNVDPERAYISSKLPYVVDYAEDPYEGLADESAYHGTHVSGIAAGNEIEDEEGNRISGVAKDAQLIFMAIQSSIGLDTGAAIAATEDAVKLHADVINMSWGSEEEYYGANPFAEALAVAENAGVMVCVAAGNYDNGSLYYGDTITADNPDASTMSDKAEKGSSVLMVASADNLYTSQDPSFTVDGEQYLYSKTFDLFSMDAYNALDYLEYGDYEYVYVGIGDEESLAEADLEGKIVLVDYDEEISMSGEAYMNAAAAGALVFIEIAQEGTGLPEYVLAMGDTPMTSVSYETGQIMIAAENKILVNDGRTIAIDHPTMVSDYTSWGVKESLDLRPDIMGVGGNVTSAGYDGTQELMSGTSMATPYLCGCVAEVCEYMRKNGIEINGSDRVRYIRNLLMNSAVPYSEDGIYVTPRRQGAGLVSLSGLLTDKVLLTGPEGDAKVNLYDGLGDSFQIPVTITNISDEDVTFAGADLVLTTDDSYWNEELEMNVLNGQQLLGCNADLSGLTSIGAGESRTVTINVKLNASQTASLKETFVNGFFVEGYLLLHEADNCCNISIPVLGYYGDWAAIPIVDEESVAGLTDLGTDYLYNGKYSLAEVVGLMKEVYASIPEDEKESCDLFSYMTDEYYAQLESMAASDKVISISPNSDGLADQLLLDAFVNRRTQYQYTILDAAGKCVAEGKTGSVDMQRVENLFEMEQVLDELPEGEYRAVLTCVIDYETSYANPQVYEVAFRVDKTAPTLKTEETEKDGRKILKIHCENAEDLDAVYITGIGNGGVLGEYDSENSAYDNNMFALLSYAQMYCETIAEQENGKPQNDAKLPAIARILKGTLNYNESFSNQFLDIIPAKADSKGQYTLEYDVTDLESYTVTASDAAYNFAFYESAVTAPDHILSGIWIANTGMFEFRNSGAVKYLDFAEGNVTRYMSSLENGILNLHAAHAEKTFTIEQLSDTTIRVTDEDGNVELAMLSELYSFDIEHSVWELEQAVVRYAMSVGDFDITRVETNLYDGENVSIRLYGNLEFREMLLGIFNCSVFQDYAMLNNMLEVNLFEVPTTYLKSGLYESYDLEHNEMYYVTIDALANRGWYTDIYSKEPVTFTYQTEEDGTFTFTFDEENTYNAKVTVDDNNGIYIYEEGAFAPYALYYYCSDIDNPFSTGSYYTVSEYIDMLIAYNESVTGVYNDEVEVNFEGALDMGITDGMTILIEDFSSTYGYSWRYNTEVDLSQPPVLPEGAYSIPTLEAMVIQDYTLRYGEEPADAFSMLMLDGKVEVALYDETDDMLDIYLIDPMTGLGKDWNETDVNLPQTGNNAPASVVMAAAAILMTLMGAAVVMKSGVIVKKQEKAA
ncbi:MAG: S8 family serine peptidase [Oscillospiraceae bacterium]|nr:S8 family serine peptidase [Oscillospiraceae bacterium]